MSQPSDNKGHPLRVNVGFLLKETAGYSREILYEADRLQLGDDLLVHDLTGAAVFTRTHEGLLAQGRIQAAVETECVRCLSPTTLPVAAEFEELWYYPPEKAPQDAEWIVGEDANLDLSPLVREGFLLGIPIHVLCRPDCRGLCSYCGQDLNLRQCDCETEFGDPRLSELRSLMERSEGGGASDHGGV